MISLGVRRIFLARAVVDMRRSYDTLAGMVRSQLSQDPLCGDAFVFIGRDRKRLKVLLWDRSGFWLCAKRLERGSFALPMPALGRDAVDAIELDAAQWMLLLEGITVLSSKRSRHYRHEVVSVV